MRERFRAGSVFAAAFVIACCGCAHAPESADTVRPDQQLDFHILYKQNCSGCHGDNGRGGAAIPLNNPAYLAVVGAQNLRTAAAKGVPGTLMPAFAQSSGGMLTDAQVDALVQVMIREWGRPSDFSRVALPPYADPVAGDPANGQKAYAAACARCHGADGTGVKTTNATSPQGATPHSIVDPSYLALVNDQNLRSYVIAGHIDDNAPDWRSYIPSRALSPQEITNIVAWIAAHRAPTGDQAASAPRTSPAGTATKERP